MPREQQSNSKEYVPPALDPVSEADDSGATWFEEDDYWVEPVPEEPAQWSVRTRPRGAESTDEPTP